MGGGDVRHRWGAVHSEAEHGRNPGTRRLRLRLMSSASYEGHGRAQLTEAPMPSTDPTAGSPVVGLALGAGSAEVGREPSPGAPTPPDEVAPGTVRRAIAGDDGAFATLIEHYDPLLRELAFHLLGDHLGMEDVLQDAYVKAYRALPRLKPDSEPRTWLSRIVYLACLDVLRRRYRWPHLNPGQHDDQEGPTSAFRSAFAGLPADQQAAVLLADRAGLGPAAVAEVLGQPEAVAVKALMHARLILHTALDRDTEPELDVR